jgi:hypothetical protein
MNEIWTGISPFLRKKFTSVTVEVTCSFPFPTKLPTVPKCRQPDSFVSHLSPTLHYTSRNKICATRNRTWEYFLWESLGNYFLLTRDFRLMFTCMQYFSNSEKNSYMAGQQRSLTTPSRAHKNLCFGAFTVANHWCVNIGDVADVSELDNTSIFGVVVCRMGPLWIYNIVFCKIQREGVGTEWGPVSRFAQWGQWTRKILIFPF